MRNWMLKKIMLVSILKNERVLTFELKKEAIKFQETENINVVESNNFLIGRFWDRKFW